MEVPASEIRKIFGSFSAEKWAELTKRLSCYFYMHYSLSSRYLDCEDLIQNALLAVYEGRRHWNPEKADLVTFLCSVMRSDASHNIRRKHKHPCEILEDHTELAQLQRDNFETYVQVCIELRSWAASDPLLTRMVEYLIEDPAIKERHLRDLMQDVSSKAIHNAYRRLNRLIRLKKEKTDGRGSSSNNQTQSHIGVGKAVSIPGPRI